MSKPTADTLRLAQTLTRRCAAHEYRAETQTFEPCAPYDQGDTITIRIATSTRTIIMGGEGSLAVYTDVTFPRCADCRRATRQAKCDLLGITRGPMPKYTGEYPSAGAYEIRPIKVGVSHTVDPVSDDRRLAIWITNCRVSDPASVQGCTLGRRTT